MDAVLLIEIVDDGSVLAGERFEALLAAGVREAAAIENKASAVAGFVLRQALVKRKTENADDELIGVVREALQFFRGQHALERGHQRGDLNGQFGLMQEPAKVLQRVGNALEKVHFAFIEAAKAVSAERLHDTDIHVSVEIVQKGIAVDGNEFFEGSKIVKVKLLAEFGRKIGLGVVQK